MMTFLRVAVVVVLTAALIQLLLGFLMSPPPLKYHGTTEKEWEPVADVFKTWLERHRNFGYAYSVYYEGKKVVDLYGGYADAISLEPYRENTLTLIFSSAKGLSALCVAMLADRGLLDHKKPVTHYWPEFGANGKESVTVETLLSHQAGLYTIEEGYNLYDIINNPEKISKQLAEQKPAWEPGTKQGYHAITIAMYMNELIRRVDPKHRTLSQFFEEEFAEPLGLDVMIGAPLSENYRIARSEIMPVASLEGVEWFLDAGYKALITFLSSDNKVMKIMKETLDVPGFLQYPNNPYVRQVPCGSYSGYGAARDLAKLMGILANGGSYNGRSYMSPETTRLLTKVLTDRPDEVLPHPQPYGLGTNPYRSPLGSRMFGTPGAGGQMVFGDPEHKLGFAFVTNRLDPGFRTHTPPFKSMIAATYDVVKKFNEHKT